MKLKVLPALLALIASCAAAATNATATASTAQRADADAAERASRAHTELDQPSYNARQAVDSAGRHAAAHESAARTRLLDSFRKASAC